MNIGKIISVIFMLFGFTLILSIMRKSNIKADKEMSNEYFFLMLPRLFLGIGVTLSLMTLIVMIVFTVFSNELPNIIFYIIFGLFFFLGVYLVLKVLKFKVIVQGEDISVYDIFIKTYTFKFDDIVLVTRQVKKNQLNSERMIIKTKLGKKLIVESAETAYKKLFNMIELKVKKEYLIGF